MHLSTHAVSGVVGRPRRIQVWACSARVQASAILHPCVLFLPIISEAAFTFLCTSPRVPAGKKDAPNQRTVRTMSEKPTDESVVVTHGTPTP